MSEFPRLTRKEIKIGSYRGIDLKEKKTIDLQKFQQASSKGNQLKNGRTNFESTAEKIRNFRKQNRKLDSVTTTENLRSRLGKVSLNGGESYWYDCMFFPPDFIEIGRL